MRMPKIKWEYLGKDSFAAQYCDYGATKCSFGIRPSITINRSIVKNPFYLFECLFHEVIHFLNRLLPEWLGRLIDIAIDVTWGKGSKDIVFDIFKIFKKDTFIYGDWNGVDKKLIDLI